MIRKQDRYAWILAALCIVSLFLFIGEALFNTRGEPREAVVALSMLQEGNWVLPVNNGVELAFKPPLDDCGNFFGDGSGERIYFAYAFGIGTGGYGTGWIWLLR